MTGGVGGGSVGRVGKLKWETKKKSLEEVHETLVVNLTVAQHIAASMLALKRANENLSQSSAFLILGGKKTPKKTNTHTQIKPQTDRIAPVPKANLLKTTK